MNDKVTIRHFKREETIFEKPGQNEAGAKNLVKTILGNLETRLSEGLLSTEEGGEHNEFALEKLRLALNFDAFVEDLRFLDRERAEKLYLLVWQLISASYRAGQLDPNGAITRAILGPEQARYMREKRANSPEEKALLAAIQAVRGAGPSDHPWKEADGILSAVNQRLESNGHKVVKVDVIRRRLQNFQRS